MSGYNVRSFEELVEADLPPPVFVLSPWLPSQGLAMLAGPTGGGKTMVALACALTIASGREFLDWASPEPRGVLYVDGEMALSDMRERAKNIMTGLGLCAADIADRLSFICSVDEGNENLSLQNVACRRKIEMELERLNASVLFLDNLSCLLNSEEENDAGSWAVLQDWLLKLRRAGYTVVFLHHTGKGQHTDKGDWYSQRGTSKREDVLNTSMLIKPLKSGGGTKHPLQLIYTKHRGFPGDSEMLVMDVSSEHCEFKRAGLSPKQAEKVAGGELGV